MPIPPHNVRAPFQPAFFPQLWVAPLLHLVSGIFGVYSYGHISQHCLDPCCCHHHLLIAFWGDKRPCDLSVGHFPNPMPSSSESWCPSSYLSLGPCRQKKRGPQIPLSPCSQAQRAGCDLSAPSYPPVKWVSGKVAQGLGLGVELERAKGRGTPQCQRWQS